MVAETAEQLEMLDAKSRAERSMGLDTEVLSSAEMLRLAPYLSPDLAGAEYCSQEGCANPLLVAPCYARHAVAAGARIWPRTEVLKISPMSKGGFMVHTSVGLIEANRVVNAAGGWAGKVAAMVGIRLPITGHVLQNIVTEPWPARLTQLVQHVGRRLSLKQTHNGTFIIGGGWPGRIDQKTGRTFTPWESLVGNMWVASRIMPLLRDVRVLRGWTGISSITPDQTAIIGEHPQVKGFYHLYVRGGFTLGPVVGRLVGELLRTGKTSIPISPFCPANCTAATMDHHLGPHL
jgi:glycine/D-amino acid oxidase-like deaminating enzyme